MKKNLIALFIIFIFSLHAVQMQKTVTDFQTGKKTILENGPTDYLENSYNETGDERIDVLWQFQDAAAIAEAISVGENGNSFVGWWLNNERVSLYSDSNIPVWEHLMEDVAFDFPVAMQPSGESMMTGTDHAIKVFEETSSAPIWEFVSVGEIKDVAIHPSDAKVYFAVYDGSSSVTLYCFEEDNDDPVWETEFGGSCETLTLSGDGSTLVFTQYGGGFSNMFVINTEDGSVMFTDDEQNQNLPAISNDGSIIVNGDYDGLVTVYKYDPDAETYDVEWTYNTGASTWIGGMAVSGDGSTVAVGTLIFLDNGYDGEIFLFNTNSPTPIWIYENAGDYVTCADLTYDGSFLVAGGYGPLDHSSADFFLFRRQSSTPIFELNTQGSFSAVDIADDGSFCTVGGKAVHAREMGSGGLLYSVDCDLGGGTLNGQVILENTEDNSGARIELLELTDYYAYTDEDGFYTIENIPENAYTAEVSKVGYYTQTDIAVVFEGDSTTLNFDLPETENPPNLYSNSYGMGPTIDLDWYAVGNPIEYNVYRKTNENEMYPEEPYATVTGLNFTDTDALPAIEYYYVVTAVYDREFESPYSNEVMCWMSYGFITNEISAYEGSVPTIDGIIDDGEWEDAFFLDCSDFWGTYDTTPTPVGSVVGYFKTADDKLYGAVINYNDTVFEDHDEVAFYIDDNNDGTYPPAGNNSEGNYWMAHYASGDVIKYRPIYDTGSAGDVSYLDNPEIATSMATGYIVYEFALPIGTADWEITPNGDNQSSIGIFVLDDPDEFDSWWPLDNSDIFDPEDYGTITFGAEIQIPLPPTNLYGGEGGIDYNELYIEVHWDMPNVNDFDYFNIYVAVSGSDFELIDNTVGTAYFYYGVTHSTQYEFYVTTVNRSGMESVPSEIFEIYTVDAENPNSPTVTKLIGNYPNPFNPSTKITFSLSADDAKNAKIEIYNVKGQKIKQLRITNNELGMNEVVWNGKDNSGNSVSSGIYLYKLTAGSKTQTKKMILMK